MSRASAPTDVRFEHRTGEDPVLSIGTATPRLSWRIPAADASFDQAAYQVEVVRAGVAAETASGAPRRASRRDCSQRATGRHDSSAPRRNPRRC
jgi:hypothetical protein